MIFCLSQQLAKKIKIASLKPATAFSDSEPARAISA